MSDKADAAENTGAAGQVLTRTETGSAWADAIAGLTADVTYYVDAANGSDDNDGLTAETALATIMAAVNKLPKNLGGHTATIIATAAGTFAENVIVEGFDNGTLFLKGDSTWGPTINGYLSVTRCGATIRLHGPIIKQPNGKRYATISCCSNVILELVMVQPDSAVSNSVGWDISYCGSLLADTIQAGNVNTGMHVAQSRIHAGGALLSTTTTGINAWSASITGNGGITGTTQFSTYASTIIWDGAIK